MSLNIKNERVHDLVREAARATGMSQTSVVEAALEHYLRTMRDQRDQRRVRIQRILGDIDLRLSEEDRAALSTDELYDEVGLPR